MFWSDEKFQKPLRIENERFPVRAIHKELLKADHLHTVSDKERKKRFFQCCNSSKKSIRSERSIWLSELQRVFWKTICPKL